MSYEKLISFSVLKLPALKWRHLAILACLKTCKQLHIHNNYAVQAKLIKQHNTAVNVNTKSVHPNYNTIIQSFQKLLLQLYLLYLDLHCNLQHFLEFGDIFGFRRYLWLTSYIFRDVVILSGEFRRHISLVMQSKRMFHTQFCMRLLAMRFSTKVFEHAKITR